MENPTPTHEKLYGEGSLSEYLSQRIQERMDALKLSNSELAKLVFKDMKVGEMSARTYISCIRTKVINPSPFGRYMFPLPPVDSGFTESLKYLFNLSVVLHTLRFEENDEVVERLRRVYTDFTYPPKREERAPTYEELYGMNGILSSLSENLGERVKERMNILELSTSELSKLVYHDIRVKETSARGYINKVRNHPVICLPCLPPWEPGYTKSLFNLAIVLDTLGIREDDELIRKFKEVYSGFNYPPKRTQTKPDTRPLEELVGQLNPRDKGLVRRWINGLLKSR